ncbi:MAG: Ig-like domain-containing protein, partial [Treponemataceae bacterium]
MNTVKRTRAFILLSVIIGVSALSGCSPSGDVQTGAVPTVVSTFPVDASTGVARSGTISATFSGEMAPATMTPSNFTLAAGAAAVSGTVAYDELNKTAIFSPDAILAISTEYTATVTTGMTSIAGAALAADTVWKFTTDSVLDTTPPTVVSTIPINTVTGVSIVDSVTATFNEGMDSATIVAANFTLAAGSTPVTGTVTYDIPTKTARFAPATSLSYGTLYTATVTTGVKDRSGNALAAAKVWSFTTATSGAGPAPVNLKTAANFVILAKTAISTVPDSVITGDVGISPAALSYMTGFSETLAGVYATAPQVTGFLYAANMTPPTPANMTTAISDVEAAYTDAAG